MTRQTRPTWTMLVLTAPSPEVTEEEFSSWYDETHVPELLEHVPGITAVTRYRIQPSGTDGADPAHAFVAAYELDRPGAQVMEDIVANLDRISRPDVLADGAAAPQALPGGGRRAARAVTARLSRRRDGTGEGRAEGR